jgi:glyoxylate/hydroxypyruvate reductase
MPVNVGGGKHVVDEDLIKALGSGQLLSYAALDALWPDPLPSGKPSGAPDRIGHAYQSRS